MKYLVGIISVLVVVVLVGSVMVPIINDSTGGGIEYEDNPDWAGWVRFDLNTSAGATYQLGMWQDENGIYVDNIVDGDTDRQTYDDSAIGDYETIMYADSNMVVWSIDDTFNVQGLSGGRPVFINAAILDINRTADGVEVVTDTDSVTFDTPTWAYVPLSQGKYGFYPYDESRGVEHPANAPTAVLGGGFAGVYAYNNIYTYDGLGLAMNPIIEDGKYYGATWEKQAADAGELNPDDITITPLDPSVIGGGDEPGISPYNPPIVIDDPFEPDAEPLGVPTPTYTDGDWGYDLMTVGGVQKAKIVSYSGAGGNVVVPATVGGYDVHRLGKNNTNGAAVQVFNNSAISEDTHVTISEGIIELGSDAFNGCTNITKIVFPDSMTTFYYNCLNGCGISGIVELPPNLTTMLSGFENCTNLTGISNFPVGINIIPNRFISGSGYTGVYAIPNHVTTIGYRSFYGAHELTALVVPESITNYGTANPVYGSVNLTTLIIASNTVPGISAYWDNTAITQVLDLSDVDYSVNRNGIPAAAEVSDSIGDCFGFISIISIAHGTPGGMGEFSNLIYAIPIVIISALLVAFGAYVIRRDY